MYCSWLPARLGKICVKNSIPLLPGCAPQRSLLFSHWYQALAIYIEPNVLVTFSKAAVMLNFSRYQHVMVTWDAEGDVRKNIFASVVALKHCILLKHLEIGQTCSLCFHLHMFKTLLAASLSSMTGGIWSFLVIFSSTSCWASSNSYQTQSVTFCPLKRHPWEKYSHE